MRRLRYFSFWLGLILLLPLATAGLPTPVQGATPAAPTTFASTQFEQVWSRTDGPVAHGDVARSWVWGPQPGVTRTEPFAGMPGGTRTVQYFDKARMEANPGVADPNSQWATTTGLLVVEMVSGRVQTGPASYDTRTPADVPVAGDSTPASSAPLYSSFRDVASLPGGPDRKAPSATGSAVLSTIDRAGKVGATASSDVHYTAYSTETGHNIPDVFARFMQTSGLVSVGGALKQGVLLDPVYVLGYPISEAYWTTVTVDGKAQTVLVQLYQRRVLTYVPGFAPAWQVQMGNVGQHYYGWRYTAPASPATVAVPTPAPQPGQNDAFVHISGSKFYQMGQPVTLKGANYWMHSNPGMSTWDRWDGNIVQQELARAHDLGMNTIRISIPYDADLGIDIIWGDNCGEGGLNCSEVKGKITNEMAQLLQIAASYNMKVLFTLFDLSNKFPQPGTAEYNRQMVYLQALVKPFADDDRVLAWDLHNEPENFSTWTAENGPRDVVSWAYNMAAALRTLDAHHPITIGVAHAETLWQDVGGRRLMDAVDFAAFHCYDAGSLSAQIAAIKAYTDKPVLLEEMGWPTGPTKLSTPNAHYDEPTQQFLYRAMINDARANGIAGMVQWALYDYPTGDAKHYIKDTIQSHFGLIRNDDTYKPAAADFREGYPVGPLPSRTLTNLPFTTP